MTTPDISDHPNQNAPNSEHDRDAVGSTAEATPLQKESEMLDQVVVGDAARVMPRHGAEVAGHDHGPGTVQRIVEAVRLDVEGENAHAARSRRKDAKDIRRALQVPGLTTAVASKVEAAISAFEAAEALYEPFRQLDLQWVVDQEGRDERLSRRRDRAEDRWGKARSIARQAAEAVLDVRTAPGLETAAKFKAFLHLAWVPNSMARHRRRCTIENVVPTLSEGETQRLLVRALNAIEAHDVPHVETQPAAGRVGGLIQAYKAALAAEADYADANQPGGDYRALLQASNQAEADLIAARPSSMAELNVKVQAFLNPDGSLANDCVPDHAQKLVEALARDIRELNAASIAVGAGEPGRLSEIHHELAALQPKIDGEDRRGLPTPHPSFVRHVELTEEAASLFALTAREAALQAALIISRADLAVGEPDPNNIERDCRAISGLACSLLHFLAGPDACADEVVGYFAEPDFRHRLDRAEDPEFDPTDWYEEWTSLGEYAQIVIQRDGERLFGTSIPAGGPNGMRANELLEQLNAKPGRRRRVAPLLEVFDARAQPDPQGRA